MVKQFSLEVNTGDAWQKGKNTDSVKVLDTYYSISSSLWCPVLLIKCQNSLINTLATTVMIYKCYFLSSSFQKHTQSLGLI